MYQDILKQRKNIKNEYYIPNKSIKRYKKIKAKDRTLSSANNYITQVRLTNKQTEEHFRKSNKNLSSISKGLSLFTNVMKTEVGLILVGAVAIVALFNFFKDKNGGLTQNNTNPYGDEEFIGDYDIQNKRYNEKDKNATIKNKIIVEAEKQGIDPTLALALADQESSFNPKAKSKTGARGIYQMTTPACQQVGIPFDEKLYDADYNIHYGLKYLKWCLQHTKSVEEALFAWNSGTGNLQKAKKAGDDLGTWNSAKRVSKEKGFTTQVMPKIERYKKELEAIPSFGGQSAVKGTSSGKIKKYYNGTKVGGYVMSNPSDKRNYIELSERARKYLEDVGGSGIVTSGAEGSHAPGDVSHGKGNKVDVQGKKGRNTTPEEYAKVASNFIKNKNTAYVNLESFTSEDVKKVLNWLKNNDYEAYTKGLQKAAYKPSSKSKLYVFGEGRILTSFNTGLPKHLDIAILPNAYSEKEPTSQSEIKKENMPKELPKQEKPKQENKEKPPVNKTIQIPNNSKQQKTEGINLSTLYKSNKKKKS